MLSCKDVVDLVANDGLAEAGPFMKFRIRMHLFICASCRRYARQLRTIAEVAKEKLNQLVPSQETINRLETSIIEDALHRKSDE
ncbi:MAG: hypothetical protein QNJ97_28710 [Myxococcota bacterium]|nr:hypothetical protein [Myxococcota bacterium]